MTHQLISEYAHFDLLSRKNFGACFARIPQTIMLQKSGVVKEWLFNSNKVQGKPILKKKRQNLHPLKVVVSLCSKYSPQLNLSTLRSISQVRDTVKQYMKNQKDYVYVKDKKAFSILTAEGQTLQISLLDFLDSVSENKTSQQCFYDKWRMIQQRVSFAKIQESYIVESIRNNHTIESKCHKVISVPGEIIQIQTSNTGGNEQDLGKETGTYNTSKQVSVATDAKTMQGYKFFDSFLSGQFYNISKEVISHLQKTYKCIVYSMQARYVINKDRQPFLASLNSIIIKPIKKITEMREFAQSIYNGNKIKNDFYMRCVDTYQRQNGENSVREQRSANRNRCKGEFCQISSRMHSSSQPAKSLPHISTFGRINGDVVHAVSKRRGRVLQKMKEHGFIDPDYQYDDSSSSEYESQDQQTPAPSKVCENCFIFYSNVLKLFDVDVHGNLIEKKINLSVHKSHPIIESARKIAKSQKAISIQQQIPKNNDKLPKSQKKDGGPKIKSERVTGTSLQKRSEMKSQTQVQMQAQLTQKSLSSIKLPKTKFQSIKFKTPAKDNQKNAILKNSQINSNNAPKPPLPKSYLQASDSLIKKISLLPSSNAEEFKYFAKKYCIDNTPQLVDRRSFSSTATATESFSAPPIPHLYEFMSNSPIALPIQNRIKRRPEMSLKRLSQLTDYPEIVSRSAFIFDTLIADQKTTIPFCIITSAMIFGTSVNQSSPIQNILLIHDVFDSFIEYISFAKDLIEQCKNLSRRIILFNRPGQSHTIYNADKSQNASENEALIDKLLDRLTTMRIIDLSKDKLKIIGIGYGGYIAQSFIGRNHQLLPSLSGILLINTSLTPPQSYMSLFGNLLEMYSVQNDPTIANEAYLIYNRAIQSEQISTEDLQHKAGLNSIRLAGRIYLLKCLKEEGDQMVRNCQFSLISCPILIVYGRRNVAIPKSAAIQLLYRYKIEVPNRKFIQIDGGVDLMADNYDGLFQHTLKFVQS